MYTRRGHVRLEEGIVTADTIMTCYHRVCGDKTSPAAPFRSSFSNEQKRVMSLKAESFARTEFTNPQTRASFCQKLAVLLEEDEDESPITHANNFVLVNTLLRIFAPKYEGRATIKMRHYVLRDGPEWKIDMRDEGAMLTAMDVPRRMFNGRFKEEITKGS
jgi:hypothetical protein